MGGDLPLVLLAIPSVIIRFIAIEPMLFGDFFKERDLHQSRSPSGDGRAGARVPRRLAWHHALSTLPFWLALGGRGVGMAVLHEGPQIPAMFKAAGRHPHPAGNKYYLDDIYFGVFAKGSRAAWAWGLWKVGDQLLIDGLLVNGSAKVVGRSRRGAQAANRLHLPATPA